MRCFFMGHKFRKVGRNAQGVSLEKYVECQHCGKVVIIVEVHPRLQGFYTKFAPSIYYDRKRMYRNISKKRRLYHMERLIDKLNGD